MRRADPQRINCCGSVRRARLRGMSNITDIRLIGNAGAVEVHVNVQGVWRLAIKDRCGDTETCDHFVGTEGAAAWPVSDWDSEGNPKR